MSMVVIVRYLSSGHQLYAVGIQTLKNMMNWIVLTRAVRNPIEMLSSVTQT